MKVSFIHTGDLHMGRQFHFNRRGDIYGKNKRLDLWETFEKYSTPQKRTRSTCC